MVLENIEVYGLKKSIKASKYPMSTDISKLNSDITPRVKSLGRAKTGSGHSQFLHGIIVQFDLTFSNKAWVEAERYHWLEFVSSQSTMHRATKFKLKEQCNEYVDEDIIAIVQKKIDVYNSLEDKSTDFAKDLYLRVLYNIPSGFQLTAAMTTNYEQLKTIYYQRRNHRLPEWQKLCKQIEKLPYFREIVLGDDN